jgi:hypothetical protein
MNDTSPESAEKMREMIRMKSPIERLKMGCLMNDASRRLVYRAIMENNPDISQNGLRQEFFLKFYGSDFDPVEREKIVQHLAQFSNEDVQFEKIYEGIYCWRTS